jgi:hypothetical protein
LAGYLTKKAGRKTLLFYGCILCFLTLFALFIVSYFAEKNKVEGEIVFGAL